MKRALIIVDIQNDFCFGGSLAVDKAAEIFPFVNRLIELKKYDLVIATKDWHPTNHKSFASNNQKPVYSMSELNGLSQRMWPDHCVAGTPGADFHPDLMSAGVDRTFYKGTNPEVDSYSGFFDNDKKSSTGLDVFLKENMVYEVDVVGLALDYCVKATAIDAASLGFKTSVLLNGTAAVNPSDVENVIKELILNGVAVI